MDQNLIEACKVGNLELIEDLLSKGANPNIIDIYNQSPLFWAAQFGHLEVVKLLLAIPEVNPNSIPIRGISPLFWPCYNGHTEVVKELLSCDKKIDPNIIDSEGATPLFWAASKGCLDIVRILLENGTDPNIIDKNGQTSLSSVVRDQYSEPVRLFQILEEYFPSLLTLSLRTIRRNKININRISPNLFPVPVPTE